MRSPLHATALTSHAAWGTPEMVDKQVNLFINYNKLINKLSLVLFTENI